MKVIGIGDNVCDKYIHLKTMFPGGQALNFSVYAKQLGADASYMGVFGTDQEAAHVIRTLDELGIEHGRCRQYEGENGCARVTLEDGDRIFLGSNKGGIAKERPLQLDEEDLKYISGFSHVHTSNNSHFDSQLALVKSTGVSLSYDFFRTVEGGREGCRCGALCGLCVPFLWLCLGGGGQGCLPEDEKSGMQKNHSYQGKPWSRLL